MTRHPGLAILAAFSAALVEAIAVVGMIVPGTPILMAVAGAAALAGLPMTPIVVVATLGAMIGDGASFWFGYCHGDRIRTDWPFAAQPALISRAETFFRRFGAPSVALARFVPVLRSTVSLVAGMARMPVRRFLAVNVSSALAWALAHVFLARLAALSVARVHAGNWPAVGIIVAEAALVAVGSCVG